jgi:hypothetical protein
MRTMAPQLALRPSPPDVLIHFHIPKTGGTSLSSMVKHGFRRDEIFESINQGEEVYGGLSLVSFECCRELLFAHGLERQKRIRYYSGHLPVGVHALFEGTAKSAKYITVLRHPVERVVSLFHFNSQYNNAYARDGRAITFEEYVESRRDINLHDYQVRLLSGAPELDAAAPASSSDEVIASAAVEKRHLEQAKRNIEEHFLAAAPVEQLADLALILRIIYGWPMRRLFNEYKNRTKLRPRRKQIPPRLLRIIEDCNRHDIELHEWVTERFVRQSLSFEPHLSRDRRVFGIINRALTATGQILPPGPRKRMAELLFYAR